MIPVTNDLFLDESELEFEFIRASGPGGQHVNKVSSAVQLRFNIALSACLPETVKNRLIQISGRRVTKEGALIIKSRNHRSQEKNKKEATERLVTLIRKAAHKPKYRIPTKPGPSVKQRRLDQKKRRGRLKRERREKFF